MRNAPVAKLKVNSMDVTEVSTDFREISTEATTEFLVQFTESMTENSPPNYEADLRFSTIDYVVFGIMLAMSGEA
jgi:hypothetical protein